MTREGDRGDEGGRQTGVTREGDRGDEGGRQTGVTREGHREVTREGDTER